MINHDSDDHDSLTGTASDNENEFSLAMELNCEIKLNKYEITRKTDRK